MHSHHHRLTIVNTVYNELVSTFGPDITWAVIVYEDRGNDVRIHYTKGNDYYSLYSYFGNNIVVLRMIYPRVKGSPSQLVPKFYDAYSPHYFYWFPYGNVINAKDTAIDTWYNIFNYEYEINPWNIFMIEYGIDVQYSIGGGRDDSRVLPAALPRGEGLCIIMAESAK